MTSKAEAEAVARLREIVSRRYGLHVEEGRLGGLALALGRMVRDGERSRDALLAHLDSEHGWHELREIAPDLTVPETYFFRHVEQLRAFAEVALPERMRARRDLAQLRILSLGCASGEEPYSLAILVHDAQLDPSWDVAIDGIDVNPRVLAKAARGRFSAWSLRETPAEARRKWFRTEGNELVLDDRIRRAVRFEERNLFAPDGWPTGTYDVVFWRNVMMYLTPDAQKATVARVTRALAPGGYLFLGHAETLRGVSNDLTLCHSHGTFYYRRSPEPAGPEIPRAVDRGAEAWVGSIDESSRRIRALSDASAQPAERAEPVESAEPAESAESLERVHELLRDERYAEALQIVDAWPAETRPPSVPLLRAVLLVHGGRLGEAQDLCRALRASGEPDAGVHYLLALCREAEGDPHGAADHHRAAIELDPRFAMPHLHLGRLARRASDRNRARRELEQALILLEGEEASRLLLFGGGFGRDALIAVCRGELRACGGTA